MNILFYTLFRVNPLIGGIERVTFNLQKSFIERGFGVYSIIKKGLADDRHFLLPSSDDQEIVRYINSIIELLKIDIVIDQYGWSNILCHKDNRIPENVKIIRCIHSDVIERNITRRLLGDFYGKPFKSLILNGLRWLNSPNRQKRDLSNLKQSIPYIDKLVLLSPTFIESLRSKKIKSDKIISIPNGIQASSAQISRKVNSVLFCGRIIHNPKNVFFLIKLWKSLQKYSNWQLIIVGDGEDLQRLQSFAKRKHINNIIFTGFVDPSDYYCEAKILLLPSFSEGFSMALLEGMTHGCVPVVFDVCPSYYDIIKDGESGFIAKNNKDYINKCEFLMTHPESMKEMSVKAKTRVDNLFTLDIVTDKWAHLFNELIDG